MGRTCLVDGTDIISAFSSENVDLWKDYHPGREMEAGVLTGKRLPNAMIMRVCCPLKHNKQRRESGKRAFDDELDLDVSSTASAKFPITIRL